MYYACIERYTCTYTFNARTQKDMIRRKTMLVAPERPPSSPSLSTQISSPMHAFALTHVYAHRMVLKRVFAPVAAKDNGDGSRPVLTPTECARKYGLRWLAITRRYACVRSRRKAEMVCACVCKCIVWSVDEETATQRPGRSHHGHIKALACFLVCVHFRIKKYTTCMHLHIHIKAYGYAYVVTQAQGQAVGREARDAQGARGARLPDPHRQEDPAHRATADLRDQKHHPRHPHRTRSRVSVCALCLCPSVHISAFGFACVL
jgi:hypothetical protein